ncbi:gas vesicle protein [Streptomyces asoensis]|uniref:Gas vesicle protein n=1 Tax=Streptomyces asoensis TaxID=249586 RepID=A0A6M4WXM4_9ACTN|nr:gas vesicle protein [Streptomyces asoensis]QJT05068.1 gas vesicle protein [Streptomyces asoensis]
MVNTKSTSQSHTSRTSHNTRESPESRNSQSSRTPETSGTSTSREGKDDVADDRPSPMEVLRHACSQLGELTGMAVEGASSFAQTEGGWQLEVEVMELERVPDTMSLMATYQVELDQEGGLTGYRRVRRYERGRADSQRSGGR